MTIVVLCEKYPMIGVMTDCITVRLRLYFFAGTLFDPHFEGFEVHQVGQEQCVTSSHCRHVLVILIRMILFSP